MGAERSCGALAAVSGMVFRAVVVGCGDIGARYDLERNNRSSEVHSKEVHSRPWTHAFGYCTHPGFTLVGVADPDPARLEAAVAALAVPGDPDPAALMASVRPDIVSIATPSSIRLDIVNSALASGARAIFCEKPLALTGAEAKAMVEACASAGVVLACNFSRRWEPGCRAAAAAIAAGAIGEPSRAQGRYARGLANNATHLIDLARWWLGDPVTVHRVRGGDAASPDLECAVGSGAIPLDLTAVPQGAFDLFEFDVMGSCGMIRLAQGGSRIVLHRRRGFGIATSRPVFVLDDGESLATDPDAAMLAALDDLSRSLRSGHAVACSGLDGLAVSRVLDAARERA